MTFLLACAQQDVSEKYRILVSTDIGGTDPDDNQSMAHLLMYSEILRMIDLYEKDFKKLQANNQKLMTPAELRKLCKQGRQGLASYKGFDKPTEGSEWIIKCARREDARPLYVLVWGTLEDVAQALHIGLEVQIKNGA